MTDTVKNGLVERAVDAADLLFAIESGTVGAMPLLMKASRVAREIGADRIEQWLEWEMRGYDATGGLATQLLSHTRRWVNEAEGRAITDPLPAIEERIESLRTSLRGLGVVQGGESPFTDQEAVFFDDAAQAAVRQISVEMQRITGQMNRLIVVRTNALAMLHAFADGAFSQQRHLLPADYYRQRQAANHRPLIAPLDGPGETDETFSGLDVEHLQGDVLDGVPITDREADGFDGVVEEAPTEIVPEPESEPLTTDHQIELPEAVEESEADLAGYAEGTQEMDSEEIAKVSVEQTELDVSPEDLPVEEEEVSVEAEDGGDLSEDLAAALSPDSAEDVADEPEDSESESEQLAAELLTIDEVDAESDSVETLDTSSVSDEAKDVSDDEPSGVPEESVQGDLLKELMAMKDDSEFDDLSGTDDNVEKSDLTSAESDVLDEASSDDGEEYEKMMAELAGILEEPLPEEDDDLVSSNSDKSADLDLPEAE